METEIIKWEDQPVENLIGKIVLIPVDRIRPDPKNLREEFDAEEIAALGANIHEIGQTDEIRVFPKRGENGAWTGAFDLNDGERRWRAAVSTGIKYLRAVVEEKPSEEDLTFKRIARVMQTQSLKPEEKVRALEKTFVDLGILDEPHKWDKYRERLGPSKEKFSELVRVIQLPQRLRQLMESGVMSYTIAQGIGKLPKSRQEDAAKFVLSNKLYGRYVVTEFIPYLLEHPDVSYAQAFEYTKVGGWRQYTKQPSKPELENNYESVIEEFLESCVKWERAWEKLVSSGLTQKLKGKSLSPYRLKDGLNRVIELAERLQIEIFDTGGPAIGFPSNNRIELNNCRGSKEITDSSRRQKRSLKKLR